LFIYIRANEGGGFHWFGNKGKENLVAYVFEKHKYSSKERNRIDMKKRQILEFPS